MKELKRDRRVNIRLNKAEAIKLIKLTVRHGMTPSQWVRERIAQARLK